MQRRKPWHLSAFSCFCYSSPIYLTASPVPRSLFKSLDGVLPLISFVWMPLPLPRRATLRQRLYERTLSRSAYTTLLTQPRMDTIYSLDDAALCVHTDGTSCISTSALEGAGLWRRERNERFSRRD